MSTIDQPKFSENIEYSSKGTAGPHASKLRFSLELNIGSLLTAVSVLVSAYALVSQWEKDRVSREVEQANQIRYAAAQTLEGLQRWREISLSLFDEVRPLLVDTSVELARSRNRTITRDNLWKNITAFHGKGLQEKKAEKTALAYITMYRFNSTIKPYFETLMSELREVDVLMLGELLRRTQRDVLTADERTFADTGILGDQLRNTTITVRDKYEAQLKSVLAAAEDFLSGLIMSPDKVLLIQKNLEAPQKPAS